MGCMSMDIIYSLYNSLTLPCTILSHYELCLKDVKKKSFELVHFISSYKLQYSICISLSKSSLSQTFTLSLKLRL